MSAGEQRAETSFGDPNARPPSTPQQTPTALFCSSSNTSSLPQTPKQTTANSHFVDEAASGWTPRFAEEYSVFNSTPGNLRGSGSGTTGPGAAAFNSHFDFAPLSPVPPSTGKKRPLSAEVPAVDLAAHVNSPSSAADSGSATFAPVDNHPPPARRLLASPEPLIPRAHDGGPDLVDGGAKGLKQAQKQTRTKNKSPTLSQQQQQQQQPQQQEGQRSTKKSRKESTSSGVSQSSTSSKNTAAQPRTQTATPPPSSRGGRKLAPRLQMENMQSQSFGGQTGYMGPTAQSQQQPHINTTFVTTGGNPDDVFGYAMGGPATAPPMTESRPFWGMDMNTSDMSIDVDLAAAGADLFQTNAAQNAQQRSMNSIDWGRTNQVFQQTGMMPQAQQDQQQQSSLPLSPGQERRQNSARRDRPLAPKTAAMSTNSSFGQTTPTQSFSFESFHMSMDDPFGTSPGGVDPGLLFGQPVTSAGMDPNAMAMSMPLNAAPPRPTSSAPANMGQITASMGPGSSADSAGHGQQQPRRLSERPSNVVSPTKNGGNRPSLSRSFSENTRGGKRNVGGGRNPLPVLAPAKPVTVHQPSLPPPGNNPNNSRSQSQNGGRQGSGRTSPLKSSHHQRLSSLTSIPENVANFPSRSRGSISAAKKTSVKFVIDENGRARAETVRDDSAGDDYYDAPEPLYPSFSFSSSIQQGGASRNSWGGPIQAPTAVFDDEEYSSSSDDEPIIIPSRNTSFSYPEPPRSSSAGNGSTSRPPTASSSILSHSRSRQRSLSDRHSSSSFRRAPAEDVVEFPSDNHPHMMDIDTTATTRPSRSQGSSGSGSVGRPSTGGSLGDAAAELRKVMQGVVNPRRTTSNPQPLLGNSRQQLTPSGPRSSSSTISEASLSGPGAVSPTPHQMGDQLRCVCNRPDAEVDGVQFLVKCDSCECLLHGRCVDVQTPQDVPHVYICAFCANTPNMRGGRMRYTGRAGAAGGSNNGSILMGPPVTSASAAAAIASSPLAHKSFRSFR